MADIRGGSQQINIDPSDTTSEPVRLPIPTGVPIEILASNISRRGFSIQNVGLARIYLSLGYTVSTGAFHFCLAKGNIDNDGLGGNLDDAQFIGAVNAIASPLDGVPSGYLVVLEVE